MALHQLESALTWNNSNRWDKEHPEEARTRKTRWRVKNREKERVRRAVYRAKNPEKTLVSRRASNQKLRATQTIAERGASMKTWRANNPWKVLLRGAIDNAVRRARKLSLTPILSTEERASILAIYAKSRALTELSGEPYQVDHIEPLAKGGLHHPDNLQILRRSDNCKKGAK